jgi:integrase
MTPRVYALLRTRYESSGCPNEGWIFPNSSKDGHCNGDTAKDQHKKGLTDSGVNSFVPYTLRHTALTRLGDAAGGDIFALARIAGHSTIHKPGICNERWAQNWAQPENEEGSRP